MVGLGQKESPCPTSTINWRLSVQIGDLVKNKSALGQARGALGIVLSVDDHPLHRVVVFWCNGAERKKYPMFLLEKV